MKFVLYLTIILLISGCATLFPDLYDPKTVTINALKSKGETLKEYEKGKNYYLFTKEGEDLFVKYRIYEVRANSMSSGYAGDPVVAFNNTLQVCSSSTLKIDCKKVFENDKEFADLVKKNGGNLRP